MNEELEIATAELVAKDFNLELNEAKDLRSHLAKRIGHLLSTNPILLKSIFYRIDLNESKLGMALVSMQGESLHEELAEQVIERLKQKAETRLRFSRPGLD